MKKRSPQGQPVDRKLRREVSVLHERLRDCEAMVKLQFHIETQSLVRAESLRKAAAALVNSVTYHICDGGPKKNRFVVVESRYKALRELVRSCDPFTTDRKVRELAKRINRLGKGV